MEETVHQSGGSSPRTSTPFEATTNPTAVLQLTSHAHSPPLQPTPHLKYDLRCIQNPPKALRDSQTGLLKRLRQHLLAHPDFQDLLDRAVGEISSAMAGRAAEGQITTEAEDNEDNDETDINSRIIMLSVAAFCARGHHRSVAFIKELAMQKWPTEWEVMVSHRDLNREKSAHGKKHGGGTGKNKDRQAGGFDLVLGDE